MQLLAEGKPITTIAEQLGITPRAVRLHLTAALESESLYPTALTPERVQELRALEAERLNKLWGSGVSTIDTIKNRIGSQAEKSLDGSSVARLLDSMTRISERLSRLLGLDVPIKSVQEVFSLQVRKIDQRVTVSFDRAQIKPDWSIDTGFRRVPPNDPTPLPALDSGAVSVVGNAMIADAPSNAPTNESEGLAT
jgi:hypothetical protein